MAQLGYSTPGTAGTYDFWTAVLGGNVLVGSGRFTTNATGGPVGSGWLWIDGLEGAGTRSEKVRLAIMGSAGGSFSGTVVGVTDEINITQAMAGSFPGLVEFPGWTDFGGPPTLPGLTDFWTAIWFGPVVGGGAIRLTQDPTATDNECYDNSAGCVYASSGSPAVGSVNGGDASYHTVYFDYGAAPAPATGGFQFRARRPAFRPRRSGLVIPKPTIWLPNDGGLVTAG